MYVSVEKRVEFLSSEKKVERNTEWKVVFNRVKQQHKKKNTKKGVEMQI